MSKAVSAISKSTVLVPLSRPSISESEIQAISAVLHSGWLTAGPKVAEFEETLKTLLNGRAVLATSSGTAALHLALLLADIKNGDEVITTPMTFAATANVILMMGAKPVFVDIDPKSWNISPVAIEQAITPRTKAIIPVHFSGRPAAMDEINVIAKKHKLIVIEDAAQAFGATFKGQKIGAGNNITCFSFHPMKQITTGEGGAITLPTEGLLRAAKRYRFHGIEKDAWKNFQGERVVEPYDIEVLGYKYNMNDIAAALGIAQLKHFDKDAARRAEVAENYRSAFASLSRIQLPHGDNDESKSGWNLFHVLLDRKISRRMFIKCLKERGIATGIYYTALHLSTLYRNVLGDQKGKYPVTEKFSDRAVALPLFSAMTDEQVNHVVESVRSTLNKL